MLILKNAAMASAVFALAAGAAVAGETRIDYTGQQLAQSRAEVVEQVRTLQARNGGMLPDVDEAWGEVQPAASLGEPAYPATLPRADGRRAGFATNEAYGGFPDIEKRFERGE